MNTLLAVLTGGGLAAAGGLLSGWQSYRFGSKRDQITHAHEQQMAREALGQERLDRAYTELGIYLSRHADWARSVQPFYGSVPAPDPMPPQERWHIETVVTNHGSKEVRQLLERWRKQAQKIEDADAVIRMAEKARDPSGLAEKADTEHQALEEYRRAMHEADEAIRDRMWAELAGQAEVPTALARRPGGPAQPWMLIPPDPPASDA
jgi:hypothetical protein